MSIHSELTTLAEIVASRMRFSVPIYQRLYVWESDQVRTLLEDLWTAFKADKPIYYLGGTLIVESNDEAGGKVYELIDGQQRFTTLWMMSVTWRGALEPFAFHKHDTVLQPRVAFPIRQEVAAFFSRRTTGGAGDLPEHPLIVDALARLSSFRAETHATDDEWNRFYKLEFILWQTGYAKLTAEQREGFRITAKNSVEHISPQNPQVVDLNTVSDAVRNTFGNLALVSRSINSEYSNLPFNEKRSRFHNRNTTRIDSLKMFLIYQNATWNDTLALEHQRAMISLIEQYLQQRFRPT